MRVTPWILAGAVAGWAALLWLVLDMGHPLAQLTMPGSPMWEPANLLAIAVMWAVMMAAMMLPSALPMIQTFAGASAARQARLRWHGFVLAYLLVWLAFSAVATGALRLTIIGSTQPTACSAHCAPVATALNASQTSR